jgi:hypothetical protein
MRESGSILRGESKSLEVSENEIIELPMLAIVQFVLSIFEWHLLKRG